EGLALARGERLDCLVLGVTAGRALVLVAHPALEHRETATGGIGERRAQARAVDRRAGELEVAHLSPQPPATGGMKTTASPSRSGVLHSPNSALIATRRCSGPSENG